MNALKKVLLIGCGFLVCGLTVSATTYTAASCSSADFQTELNLTVDGDTVNGPNGGGTATWSTRLTIPHSITFNGKSCSIALSGVDAMATNITATTLLRITGFTFTGTSSFGAIDIDGVFPSTCGPSNNLPCLRIDHNTFTNLPTRSIIIGYQNSPTATAAVWGVIDHNTFTPQPTIPAVLYYGINDSWFSAPTPGTFNALYFENNSYTWGGTTWSANQDAVDVEVGGQIVQRYETIVNGSSFYHDTGGTPQSRGVHWWERYNNSITCTYTDGSCYDASGYRGGSGYDFNNSIGLNAGGSGGFVTAYATEIFRLGSPGGAPMNFTVGADSHTVSSSFRGWYSVSGSPTDCKCSSNSDCGGAGICNLISPPNDAACGTGYKVISDIDGSGTGAQLGYPARDQLGVGSDNPSTHAQVAAGMPAYSWSNTDPNNSNAVITNLVSNSGDTNYIQPNIDFYEQGATFTGATGTGTGLLSARPSTCTVAVGYFATDTNTLYLCKTTNTWTASYSPAVYPDPLVSGTVTLSPSLENFGSITVGSSSSLVIFTVTNNSSASMTSVTVVNSGGNTGDFTITNTGTGSCGSTVTTSSSCSFTVVFSPASTGARSTTLQVSYSGGDGASQKTSSLSGTGIAGSPGVASPVDLIAAVR